MAASLEFGLFDWIDRAPGSTAALYESRLKLIERADAAGFYGYHLAEHHGTDLGMAPSPALFFAAVAQRTQSIRFSPMAYLLPLYHPVRLVEEICMLDHLSNGRMEVGVSRGVSPHEIRCFGVEPEQTPAIFAETLNVLVAAMRNDVLNHDGAHYQFHDVPMAIKPQQKPYPPLWYPSFSESGTTYAAENGYNFLTLGPPSLVSQLAALYREVAGRHAQTADRLNGHVSDPKIGAMRQLYIAQTDEQAMEIAHAAYDDWYQNITQLWHRKADASYDEFFKWDNCLAGETILIGSVETVRERIQQLVSDSGINYFVGSFAWGSLTPAQCHSSLDLFINEIMPAINV